MIYYELMFDLYNYFIYMELYKNFLREKGYEQKKKIEILVQMIFFFINEVVWLRNYVFLCDSDYCIDIFQRSILYRL